jgi:hypothetical protein
MAALNPYALLTPELLAAMLKQPMYFVRQHYPRGADPAAPDAVPLLLTHYAHHETDLERAERHLRLLKKDRYRFLYNSSDPEHLARLQTAAQQPDGFRVYINLLPKKWKPSEALKRKIGMYMMHCLPGWQYSPAGKLNITLKERYGDLYLALLWKGQQTEVRLSLVEDTRASL